MISGTLSPFSTGLVSSIVSVLIPLTIVLVITILIRTQLRKSTDSQTAYRLWGVIPLCLLFYFLPLPAQYLGEFNSIAIQTYLVNPAVNVNQHIVSSISTELSLTVIWFAGLITLISTWLLVDIRYRKKLTLTPASHSAFESVKTTANGDNSKLNSLANSRLSLAQSSHIHSPMLIGLFKQTLVIPEDFSELYTTEQQQLVIEHEVCHFSHHHMWANQLALLLLALFWFHPLAWRAYALFRQDQEHACDQLVLARKQTQSRIEYCKALVLAAETSPPNAFTLMSFKHNGEQHFMFNRIEQIKRMKGNKSASKTVKLAIVTALSVSLLTGVSYAGNQYKNDGTAAHKQFEVHPTHRIEPKYPIKAANAGTEGSVVLKFDVIEDGSVTNVVVVNAKPAYVFDKESIRALKQWRYKANNKVTKGLLVQLDFLMDNSSTQPESLIERIQVNKH